MTLENIFLRIGRKQNPGKVLDDDSWKLLGASEFYEVLKDIDHETYHEETVIDALRVLGDFSEEELTVNDLRDYLSKKSTYKTSKNKGYFTSEKKCLNFSELTDSQGDRHYKIRILP